MYKYVAVLLFVLLGLSGCASGYKEFETYSKAFNVQNETAQEVLNKLAIAERRIWRRRYDKQTTPNFQPEFASYYVDSGDPLLTGSIRKTVLSVKLYNEALSALANGEASSALSGRITTISSNMGIAISGFGDVTKSAALGSLAAGMSNPVSGNLLIAKDIFDIVARSRAQVSYRQNLLKAYPAMRDTLTALRDGSKEMYSVLRASNIAAKSPRSVHLADRKLISSWHLLMDDAILALDVAAAATKSGNSFSDLSALSEASIELRILAEKLKAERQALAN